MSLSPADVTRIAHLARLQLSPSETERTLTSLNGIVAMIEQIQAVDTTGIEPMAHPLGGAQRLRVDAVTDTPDRELNLRNAPAQQDGLFLVPKVVE